MASFLTDTLRLTVSACVAVVVWVDAAGAVDPVHTDFEIVTDNPAGVAVVAWMDNLAVAVDPDHTDFVDFAVDSLAVGVVPFVAVCCCDRLFDAPVPDVNTCQFAGSSSAN